MSDDGPEAPQAAGDGATIKSQIGLPFKLDTDSTALSTLIANAADAVFSRLQESRDTSLRGLMMAVGIDDMKDADLTGVDLRGEDLSWIDFEGADFTNADLRDCDLRNANLRNTVMAEARLEGAKLLGANLEGALSLPTYPLMR